MSDDPSNTISSTSSHHPPSSSSFSSIDSESSSADLSSHKDGSDGGPPPKLRVRRRKLSELAPWEIWRCVRCGKCYSKTSKAAILEHVRVLCQAGTHDDEEIRRQMAMYARKQGGWIYSGKKMGLANTYNMNNYTLAPFHPSFAFGQVPFGYFPGAAAATPVNRYANFPQTPLMSSTHNNNNSNSNNNNMNNNNNNNNAEPSSKRAKYDGVSLAVASVKGTARSLSSESSSSSGGTSPGSRLSPINHPSADTSRSTSNDSGNADSNEGTAYTPYGMNEFNYGGSENGYQNGYGNNYSNYGYMNMNYPFAQQNFNSPPVANARRATNATDVSSYYPNAYPATMNNFVPRGSPATNGRY